MKGFKVGMLIICIAVIFFGCASIQSKQVDFVVSGYNENAIQVTVTRHIQFGDGTYEAANPDKVISGFSLNIKNNSGKPAKIVWDNSSITDSGGTHRLFLSGMRFIDSNNSIPPNVIPDNGNLSRDLYNADNVEYVLYAKTWRINPMNGFDFTIVLCIEQDGKEDYLNIDISVKKI
jgi:hypothetical protein